ncbi:dihydropteroate synthase [Alkalihalobacillus alcalophilus ATCC 27647 = CGMCC 1.3604]|uniref:Dihydropteroate synthase n=2 Tax=Alkalihalobacillus alcalophilus TaxID=1445 RepID=A0A094WK52_ALKAL|nr:dihydropteroate synthase [Alkalihalobacillus alcalophilus ATCC 27647 = CGMCC 1.3604]THG92399.1 dihydropteroate synthase [Alkalihalobacillus alcalophilus ATCC 27647 = CGMCC 1.3604]
MDTLLKRNRSLLAEDRTYVMGILNATPDSFSDGGKYNGIERAVARAKQLVLDGADILDIGGESTRPGFEYVEIEEEIKRVVPVIKAVATEVDVPISIDTYKPEVAKAALEAGASVINDIWGAKKDPKMAELAVQYNVPIILMHNREEGIYQDLILDMRKDLQESIDICLRAGVPKEHIILDPGIGFAKTYEENLKTMRHLSEFVAMGYPVLLGTSKKSLIAQTLNLPVDERTEGTGATVCYGVAQGCQIVRVHDVKEMTRMTKMMDAMLAKGDARIG